MTTPAIDLLLARHRDRLGESPLWSAAEQALYWVDIEGRALRRWSFAQRQLCSWQTGQRLACIALHQGGGLIAGMETGLFQLQPQADGTLGASLISAITHPQPGMRCNDGRCDRLGRFWVGTMLRQTSLAQPAGSLYRMDARGLSAPLVAGLITPNGLAFSPDGATMYLSDSHAQARQIWSLPLHADGTPGARRLFADLRDLPGRPDGAAVDAEGCYWSCANDAGVLQRFTPQGRLDRTLAVPTSKPSMCSFGGPGLDLLFITTIRPEQARGADLALGGAVFVTRPGVTGLPETPYRTV